MKREDLIEEIFSKKIIFEKEVLNIKSDKDKCDVMHILAKTLVHDILKEHLNFLHLKSLSDFTLKHIVNILFKELASEWISFSMDVLEYSKDEALSELQKQKRVKYIHSLAEDYYKYYHDYIYEEISNTFIDLLASTNPGSEKIKLINAIINSELVANRSILNINSYDQLYRRIIAAKNAKNIQLSAIQMKLSDILIEIESYDTSEERRESLLIVLPKYKEKNKAIAKKNLEDFDASLQRVKMAIFNSLKNDKYKN